MFTTMVLNMSTSTFLPMNTTGEQPFLLGLDATIMAPTNSSFVQQQSTTFGESVPDDHMMDVCDKSVTDDTMNLEDDSFADPDIDLITQMLEQMTLTDTPTSADPDLDLITQMLEQMTLTDTSTSADPDIDLITQMLEQMTLTDKSTSSEEWKDYFQQHCIEELMGVIEARQELTGSEKFAITLYTQDATNQPTLPSELEIAPPLASTTMLPLF
jgi:hypothetical protein